MKQWNERIPPHKMLLISDLDGTLLDRHQKISYENQRAIEIFIEKGGLFTLATGRMEAAVEPFISQLKLKIPLIVYNGAKIYHPVTKTTLYEKKLSLKPGILQSILDLHTKDTAVLLYQQGEVYTPNSNALINDYEKKENVFCKRILEKPMDGEITKILIITRSETRMNKVEEVIDKANILCNRVYSEHNYLELLPPQASKGTALLALKQLLQLEDYYIIAVGDQLNDLSLIQEADLGIVVENAHDELKRKADWITQHHDYHAIANIIKIISV